MVVHHRPERIKIEKDEYVVTPDTPGHEDYAVWYRGRRVLVTAIVLPKCGESLR